MKPGSGYAWDRDAGMVRPVSAETATDGEHAAARLARIDTLMVCASRCRARARTERADQHGSEAAAGASEDLASLFETLAARLVGGVAVVL